jgi:hypothetical protein
MERTFKLTGEGFDLDILRDHFRSPRATVEKIEDQCFLRIAGESWTGDDDADWSTAEDELSQINGIAKLLQPNFRAASLAGFSERDPVTGAMTSRVRGRVDVEIRTKVGISFSLVDSKTGNTIPRDSTTEGEKLLSLCDKHEHLARALLIYGALPHEWRELSMVVDAIVDHHGSKRELEKKDYYPPKLDDFVATANSFKAIKLGARHGWTEQKGGGVEEPRITLNEAKEVIRKLLEDTLNSLKPQA